VVMSNEGGGSGYLAVEFAHSLPPGEPRRKSTVAIDLTCFKVYADGLSLALTRLEFDLLVYLFRNSHRVVPASELVTQVIRSAHSPGSSLIRVHISHLRRKLGCAANIIETVRGRGLRIRS
jgi:DNA-binding response OmpR family regulator